MKRLTWLALGLLVLWTPAAPAQGLLHRGELDRINRHLAGTILDFTNNYGTDRRIWSQALHQRRNLYVYLPPGFDPCRRYPFVMWLHGFMQDEQSFARYVAAEIDRAILSGKLPPVIVAAPDGSVSGRASYFTRRKLYINSKAGNFADYIMDDVWVFVNEHFPLRPEREAHVLAGVSMGGFGAFNLGIKHADTFKVVVGIFPPLNLRWVDCHCRYMSDFNPCCWGWRTQVERGHEVIGRFYLGLVTIRLKQVIDPLFGRGPEAVAAVARENPIEMLTTYGVPNGLLDMYVAYGGRDEYNINAQVESFLFTTNKLGIEVGVNYDPKGRHNLATARRLFPGLLDWLGPRLAPYAPEP